MSVSTKQPGERTKGSELQWESGLLHFSRQCPKVVLVLPRVVRVLQYVFDPYLYLPHFTALSSSEERADDATTGEDFEQ